LDHCAFDVAVDMASVVDGEVANAFMMTVRVLLAVRPVWSVAAALMGCSRSGGAPGNE
jgi:hypothetical protein